MAFDPAMPRRAAAEDNIYLDEAEGVILSHTVANLPSRPSSLPRKPSPERLAATRKRMEWDNELPANPNESLNESYTKRNKGKRREFTASEKNVYDTKLSGDEEGVDQERCSICLMGLRDRTIVGVCRHEFCFHCICLWANRSRKCPLCSGDMAAFFLHDLAARIPTKYYLPPLRHMPAVIYPTSPLSRQLATRQERPVRGQQERIEHDELKKQVLRRKEYYKHGLYVKHMGSNRHSRFRPNPNPKQINDSPEQIQRAKAFIRRELRIFPSVHVESLTLYIIFLLKCIDIRSDVMIRIMGEVLDTSSRSAGFPNGTEHFIHELYSFLRSPYRELKKYDEVAKYGAIPQSPPFESRHEPCSSSSLSSCSSYSRPLSPHLNPPLSPLRYRCSPSPFWSPPHQSGCRSPLSRRDIPAHRDELPAHCWQEQHNIRPELRRGRSSSFSQGQQRRDVRNIQDRARKNDLKREREENNRMELLPSPPTKRMRIDDMQEPHMLHRTAACAVDDTGYLANLQNTHDSPPHLNAKVISIRGVAGHKVSTPSLARPSLKERLNKAKMDISDSSQSYVLQQEQSRPSPKGKFTRAKASLSTLNKSKSFQPEAPATAVSLVEKRHSTTRAKIQMRLKLEHERANLRASTQFVSALPSSNTANTLSFSTPTPKNDTERWDEGVEATINRECHKKNEGGCKMETRIERMVEKLNEAETESATKERKALELKLKLLKKKVLGQNRQSSNEVHVED
ncbi:uncharacterized protein L203_100015 [Cryptococcus depauperatus CBS 7841]|uniref:RING-type E3 ubiquitin transferase n=1 Tax=Cryptococcus depauperatus CBS 7841 TaxID=1295531 RepID=A0AAJ8JMA3_9TREE